MKYEVYCVGEMVIDFTPTAEKATYCAHPGGAPANVAIAMARLGRRTAFTGKVGMMSLAENCLRPCRRTMFQW